MAEYKLTYFGVRARAEPIRLTFAAAGKKFEDVRVTGEQWATMKDKTPYGQMPMLQYKGKIYGESKAVASFVAKECGLAGKNNVDAMRVDEVYCLFSSVLEAMGKVKFESDTTKQAEMQKTLATETIPKFLGFFEKMLKEAGKGFFIGSALTQADLTAYDLTVSLLKMNPKVLDGFPEIQKMRKNVEGNKNVKAYLDSRPDSDF